MKKEEAPKGFIGKAVKAFDDWFARTLAKYVKNVEGCIRKSKLILTCLVIVVICIGFLAKATPTGFVPNEDQGMTAVSIALPEGASSNRTQQVMAGLSKNISKLPGVKNVMEVSGIDILSMGQKANAGLAVVSMEDYSKRSNSVQDIIPMIFGMGAQIPDATVMAFQPPSLPGASSTGTLSLYLMNLGGEDVNTMGDRANEFLAACRKRPEIGMLYTTLNTNTPMYQFEVDREKAQSMNVPVSTVYSALQAFLGGNEINDINNFGRTWKVVMQADEKYRTGVEDMRYFFVRSNDGQSIPLNTLVKPMPKNSSVVMTRFNGASAIKISGDPASGYSSGQAMTAIEEVAKEVLPNTYTYEWTGQSLDEIEAGSRSTQIFIISLIFVFLCLAALYESWTIPLAVLLSVPSAVFGCFLVQYARGLQNDVYMQIGLITLIGLAAKNAILIVEYAKMNMEQGMDVVHAAVEAAHVRLRPILMTSFAFILGCLPLAIATGPGAGARVSMGNAVVGGMTIATLFGIFLIPVLFVVVERFFSRKKKNPDDNVTEQL